MIKKEIKYHFDEDQSLAEVLKYVDSTYVKYYVGENDVQSLDLINGSGHGEGFAIGNIIKLASRYGKKEGHNREDILKMIHYSIVLLHLNNKRKENVEVAQESV